VQVANLDSMLVRAFVDEPEIGKLAKGERIEVTWDALPGRTWSGSLSRVPTAVSTLGPRTVGEITSAMANEDHRLLPNVNVSVSVITAAMKARSRFRARPSMILTVNMSSTKLLTTRSLCAKCRLALPA